MVFKFCAIGCNNTNRDAQMHIFPKEQPVANLWCLPSVWIHTIGRMDLREMLNEHVRKSYRLCDRHFGPEASYVGQKLRRMPSDSEVPVESQPRLGSQSLDESPSTQTPEETVEAASENVLSSESLSAPTPEKTVEAASENILSLYSL